ncbi:coiled-coil domain-containing protein 57-like isoform X2 [Littorina saxatilis]|uniref:coiled-coil domain-containing protein 57-like isoform X2 n=1 Tax=Littorina saxatilis TaxID=31220 RepID=UPI0038B4D30E
MLRSIMDYRDPDVLKELSEQKEKEWKDISDKRLQALEAALSEKDRQLSQQTAKFQKLKEDFKYNLKLLEERDQELERYDLAFTDVKAQLNVRNAEVSELQIKLDDTKKLQQREQQARDELHASYQQRLREKQAEIEAFKNAKNGELQQERNEFDSLRRTLQRQLTELQAELEKQRQELSMEFEDAMKKREHEFRAQVDEMNAKVLEYDLKAQLLSKELALVRGEEKKQSEQAEEAFHGQRELEKQLKQAQWQVADVTAMKDARIKELSEKLRHQEKATALLQEDFQRKYAELDRSMREHEASAQRVKASCSEKEEALVQERQQLQSQLEDAQIQIRQLQWTNSDLKKDHEVTVERLREELQQLQSRWDSNLKDMSRDTVSRDVELQAAHEEISRLKSDLAQRKDDLDRYKKELLQATEREKSLDQSKTQAELDWQRRCEELERRQYNKSEDLIISLTQSRDEALAECKEKSRELEHSKMMLRAVSRDRDIALATLKKHDIPLDKNFKLQIDKHNEQEAENLRDQNQSLRAALASMKQMMESMGHTVPTAVAIDTHQDNEYVTTLEKELKKLKHEKRDLAEKVATAERFGRLAVQPPPDSEPILSEVKDSNIRNHIKSLNDMLGVLRGEKVELAAVVKKQQVRIQHLEEELEEARKEPRELQVTLEQLRYENGAQQRRHAAETAAQRQRITLLEGQLSEAQREADMFHQASVENNAELTALRNQISSVKLDLAERHPAVNFGAQELVIQQLQEELKSSRQRAASAGFEPHEAAGTSSDSPSEHKAKLRQAAQLITQLVREKQQLLELSNKLRAELKLAGVNPSRAMSAPKQFQSYEPAESLERDVPGRLSQLERLQYELTRQELQYAQRFAPPPNRDGHTPEKDRLKAAASPGDNLVQQSMGTTASSLGASSALPGGEMTSSVGSQSVLDILRMVDGPESPDLDLHYSARRAENARSSIERSLQDSLPTTDSRGIVVSGQKVKVDQKGQTAPSRPLSSKAAGKVQQQKGKAAPKPRIRNYNLRDSSDFR